MTSICKRPFLKAGVIIALFFSFTISNAQSVWTIGPRAGVNYSWISRIDGAEPKIKFTGGAFVLFSKWEHFGVSADLLYSARGMAYEQTGTDVGLFRNEVNLHFIELPILATYFFNPREHSIRPKLYAGPSVNYLVFGEHIGEHARKASFKELDYALVVGGGFNFKLASKMWLNVDARYTHGFVNMNEYSWVSDKNKVFNRSVGLTVGLGFGIGGDGGSNDVPAAE
ncbi:MAG TPA: porin family protein [Bacteroidia bacterium]|nr:porin family protein [Bacteroidia bacterium]